MRKRGKSKSKKSQHHFRLVGWVQTADGTGLAPVCDIGRYKSRAEVEEWATAILEAGNSEFADIYQDRKLLYRIFPKGTRH